MSLNSFCLKSCLEKYEDRVVSAFSAINPEHCIVNIICSYERMILHGLCQYLDIKSKSELFLVGFNFLRIQFKIVWIIKRFWQRSFDWNAHEAQRKAEISEATDPFIGIFEDEILQINSLRLLFWFSMMIVLKRISLNIQYLHRFCCCYYFFQTMIYYSQFFLNLLFCNCFCHLVFFFCDFYRLK